MNIKEITIDEMREDLAEREAMNMNVSDIIDMLMYGVGNPLNEVPDSEIKEEWENIFEKNLFQKVLRLMIRDKAKNNSQRSYK